MSAKPPPLPAAEPTPAPSASRSNPITTVIFVSLTIIAALWTYGLVEDRGWQGTFSQHPFTVDP